MVISVLDIAVKVCRPCSRLCIAGLVINCPRVGFDPVISYSTVKQLPPDHL